MKRLLFIICILFALDKNISATTLDTESQNNYSSSIIADKTSSNVRTIQNNLTTINDSSIDKQKHLAINEISSTMNIESSISTNKAYVSSNKIATNSTESAIILNKTATDTENDVSLDDLGDTLANVKSESATNIIDPHENFNRNAYRMNDTLDKHFIRPVTVWYVDYVPGFIRAGAQNFFNNLRDFVSLGNDILQLNTYRSIKDTGRVCINSTIGLLGLFDIASYWGMPEHINTFGHTMRFYGWENSSYVVLPFFGPSTIRDALGMIPDTFFNPTWWIDYPYSNYVSVGLFTVSNLDARAKLLPFDQSLNTAIDPYSSVRDFYLQSTGNMPPATAFSPKNNNESTATINTNDNDSQLENLIDEKQ